jgi:hypothetical protein
MACKLIQGKTEEEARQICLNCPLPQCVYDFEKTLVPPNVAAYQRRYYQEHKDEVAAYHRRYYQEHKDERAAYQRRYCQEHKDEVAAYQRRYRQEHKDERARVLEPAIA